MVTQNRGVILLAGIVVLSLVEFAKMRRRETVMKPVVPNFCQQFCNETIGCCSYIYMAYDLSCHMLASGKRHHWLRYIERKYARDFMACPNNVEMIDDERKSQCKHHRHYHHRKHKHGHGGHHGHHHRNHHHNDHHTDHHHNDRHHNDRHHNYHYET